MKMLWRVAGTSWLHLVKIEKVTRKATTKKNNFIVRVLLLPKLSIHMKMWTVTKIPCNLIIFQGKCELFGSSFMEV